MNYFGAGIDRNYSVTFILQQLCNAKSSPLRIVAKSYNSPGF
jgi:hypothetical protein